MPTYEYKCDACEATFERFQSITAPAVKKCPQCGKNKVRRLISGGAGLIFKGSGFYITDYRSDSYKSAAKADSGSDAAKPAAAPSSTNGQAAKSEPAKSEPAKPAAAPAKAK